MKGLLLKDFYMAKRYCRLIGIVMLLCLVVSVIDMDNSFFMVYPIVFASIIPVTLISYDERSRWNIYSAIFPWSRSQVVSAKYLISFILIGMVWVLSILAQGIRILRDPSIRWDDSFMMLSILLVLGFLASSFILPIIFKLGVEKGRIAYYAVIVLVCAATAALSTAGVELNMNIPLFWIKWLPVLIIIAGICIFVCSWLLSVRFYEKREL